MYDSMYRTVTWVFLWLLLGLILALASGCTTNMAKMTSDSEPTQVTQSGTQGSEALLSKNEKAMMHAAWDGQLIEVERLLKAGVDPDSLGYMGMTALSLAAQNNQIKIVKTLLDHGANPSLQDNKAGWFPLMWAAYNGNLDIAKLLIEHGADVNMQNKYGETSMIHAAFEGRDDMIELLLEHGADYSVKNDRGFDAMRAAQNKGFYRIVEILIKAGAKQDTGKPVDATSTLGIQNGGKGTSS